MEAAMIRTIVLAALLGAGSAVAAQSADFFFSPVPRWRAPNTEAVCAAVQRECPAMLRRGSINGELGYDALYDSRGMLRGLRVTRSTGCAPLDEHLLLGQRREGTFFRSAGPDLPGFTMEGPRDASLEGMRIVKAEQTGIGLDCS
jgi:hypothetical protein